MRVVPNSSTSFPDKVIQPVLRTAKEGILRYDRMSHRVANWCQRQGLPERISSLVRRLIVGLPFVALRALTPFPVHLAVVAVGLGVYIAKPEWFQSRTWSKLEPMVRNGFATFDAGQALRCTAIAISTLSVMHLVLAGLWATGAFLEARWANEAEDREQFSMSFRWQQGQVTRMPQAASI